jgi:hypothetical protein
VDVHRLVPEIDERMRAADLSWREQHGRDEQERVARSSGVARVAELSSALSVKTGVTRRSRSLTLLVILTVAALTVVLSVLGVGDDGRGGISRRLQG